MQVTSTIDRAKTQFLKLVSRTTESPNPTSNAQPIGDSAITLHDPEFKISFNDYKDGFFRGVVKTQGKEYPIQFIWYGQSSGEARDLRATGKIIVADKDHTHDYKFENTELHGALRAAAKRFVLQPLEESVQSIRFTSIKSNKNGKIIRYSGLLRNIDNNPIEISYKPESELLIIDGYTFGFKIDQQKYPKLTKAIDDCIKGTPPDTIE
jgi:hypothetical protein